MLFKSVIDLTTVITIQYSMRKNTLNRNKFGEQHVDDVLKHQSVLGGNFEKTFFTIAERLRSRKFGEALF